jgi:O-antigen ligase
MQHSGPVESGRWTPALNRLLLLTVFLFFASGMTLKGGTNICLFLMFLLALPLLRKPDRQQWWLFAALSATFWITLLQLLFGMPIKLHVLDAPSRFLLAGCCLFALSHLDAKRLSLACYGCIPATFGVMAWGYISLHVPHYFWGDGSRAWNGFSNPIPFGSLSVLLGFLSLILPIPQEWQKHLGAIRLLKLAALGAGLYAGYCSGSRAAMIIAIPLIFLAISHFGQFRLGKVLALFLPAMLLAGALIMGTSNRMHARISEGCTDLAVFHKDQNTSMGLRLEMWKTGAQIFVDHPLRGIGKGGFYDEVNRRITLHLAPSLIQTAPHPHDELLNMADEMGLPGLLAGLLLYLVPGILFCSRLRAENRYARFAASAGAMVVIGHFCVGLVDVYFWIVSQTAFYGVSVAVFAAILLAQARQAESAR